MMFKYKPDELIFFLRVSERNSEVLCRNVEALNKFTFRKGLFILYVFNSWPEMKEGTPREYVISLKF